MIAVDIDEKSVEIAKENADLNNVGGQVDFVVGDGLSHSAVMAGAPYEFIFANILAGPLIDFAPAIADSLVAPGRVMLAGLMSEQEAAVTEAYENAGLKRINRLDHETWPVLLFAKPISKRH